MAKQDPTSAFLKAIRAQGPKPGYTVPAKTQVTIDLDADVLAYFETGESTAMTHINRVLRAHVDATRAR